MTVLPSCSIGYFEMPHLDQRFAKIAGEGGDLGRVAPAFAAAPEVHRERVHVGYVSLVVEDEGERPTSPGAAPLANGNRHRSLTPAEL
jgi:hypothetical protein